MALKYKVAGVDVTDLAQRRSFTLRNQLETRSDFASIIFEDDDNNFDPRGGQEFVVERNGSRIFGGIIASPKRMPLAPGRDAFKIKAQDFIKLIEKRLVNKVYFSTTAGDIVKDILSVFVLDPNITTVNVQDGPVLDFIGFNFRDARLAINEVARRAGMLWYVDEDKDVHLFTPTTTLAPFNITETEERYRKLTIKPNFTQIKNRVTVRGGTSASAPFSEIYQGNAEQTTFPVSYPPTATPTVDVAIAAGPFNPETVGIKNIDDGTTDWLFDPNNLVMESDQHGTLGKNERMRQSYTYKVPILVRIENPASISEVAAIEDSDGIYEFPIEDKSIETNAAARERAQEELDRFSRELSNGSFETFEDGFRSGQLIVVSLPSRNINITAIITRATLVVESEASEFFKVEFGDFSYTFVDFLLSLHDKEKVIAVREGEVLDDLEVIEEQLPLQDEITDIVSKTPPFKWQPSAINPLNWNLGQWG